MVYLLIALSLTGGLPPVPPAALPLPVETNAGNPEWIHAELSPAQEQAMWEEIHRNLAALQAAGSLTLPSGPAQALTYNFPLQLAPGQPDFAGFRVSAFSDHNPASGPVLDYNGGTRTYDGHRGTDYALWPFSWNKLNSGSVQVIAAAAGTIINKSNVDPSDHNCNVSSSDPWNYIALLHSDGRLTVYGHMRYNSLTAKAIGQTVAQGEYLGLAGSSGNSSGPHLHFEVRYGSFSTAEWIDPYAGPNSQPQSLWASQRPYYDSAINRLSTHFGPPATPDPCQPTVTKLQDSFTAPANVYFYAFYRDYQNAIPTQLKIYRPDGSIFTEWQYTGSSSFSSAWSQGWVYAFSPSDPPGTWRFEAAYNGQTNQTFFNLNDPTRITVSSPNGGEQWDRRLPQSVTWQDNLGGEVNIALYRSGVYSATLASSLPSTGAYLWTPGPALAAGPGYTIRITSVISPGLSDESDSPFTLANTSLVARDDFAITAANTPVAINVLGNDTFPASTPITITAAGPAAHGAAGLVNAQIVFTPALDYLGGDVFTYTVRTSLDQAQAVVTVLVAASVKQVFLPVIRR